jgi:hypothetical protein
MDYVEVLENWCVRRGVPLPVYREEEGRTYVSFLGKEYNATPAGSVGEQCAAQEAYESSGVFGKVIQSGFVPLPRRDKEFLVDLANAPPGCLTAAVSEAPMNVQVTAFTPYKFQLVYPTDRDEQPYSYTIYETVHHGEEAYWARVEWYIQMRLKTWVKDETTIYIYSSYLGGERIRAPLEAAGLSVVLL